MCEFIVYMYMISLKSNCKYDYSRYDIRHSMTNNKSVKIENQLNDKWY